MRLTNLQTNFLGKNNFYYEKIDSTQAEVWRLYDKNAPSGTLVFADLQSAGRGTHGRKWHTDEKNNIAFSFFIKTDCEINKLDGITIEIAKIILRIFKEKYNIKLDIKEPNDITFNKKKIAGILTETKVIEGKVKCIVCGIGINTLQEKFAEDIKEIATSIKNEFNKEIDVESFIAEFCNLFEKEIIERIN